jgi:hypothetical protein
MNKICVARCVDRVMVHFIEPLIPIGHGRNHTCRSFREAILLAHHYVVYEGFHNIVEVQHNFGSRDGTVFVDLSSDAVVLETLLRYG